MFTLPQIKAAHSKVKSGADFPQYIQDLIALGVTGYETFVFDGHTDYKGTDGFLLSAEGRPDQLTVSRISNPEQFRADLKNHQNGHTDYPRFLNDCAQSGVEKWVVGTERMTCTYYDKAGNQLLVEKIPEV